MLYEMDRFLPSVEDKEVRREEELEIFSKLYRTNPIFRALIHSDDEECYDLLVRRLGKIPEKIIRRVLEFGVRFFAGGFDLEIKPSKLIIEAGGVCLGGYIPEQRLCYLSKEAFRWDMPENLSLIPLAHAFDHSLGVDHCASSADGSLFLWHYLECKADKIGHRFISEYAGKGPKQYFAQCMASYFSQDSFCGRERLKWEDESMYFYLDSFFRYYIKCVD